MHPSVAIASLLVLLGARPTGATSCLQLALQLEGTLAPCLTALQRVLDGTSSAAAAASSLGGATLQGCCSGLGTFNAASCLCDATVTSVISSAVPSGLAGLAPLVASTCGGLQLSMTQPSGTCGVAAMPPPPSPQSSPPLSRPPPLPPTPTVSPSTHAPPPANSSAPAPAVPPPPLPPAVAAASGPTTGAPLGLLAAAEVLIQLALAQQLASPPPPPVVQPGVPPAQHSSAGRPAHPLAHALGALLSAFSALRSLG